MTITKIPFGQNVETGMFQDVHEVVQGKGCGCICPSCKALLIAVKGTKNAWHFRHNSNNSNYIENDCNYSFHVSIRMMAKQIIQDSLNISTPDYYGRIDNSTVSYAHVERYLITVGKNVVLTDIRLDEKFESVTVDVLAKVGIYDFVIYFTHQGRDVPVELANPINEKCGILQIKTESWETLFFAKKKQGIPYADILLDLICNDLKSKSWVYHPKTNIAEALARKKLNETIQQKNQYFKDLKKSNETHNLKFSKNISTSDMKEHRCRKCNHNWRGYIVKCPNCGETQNINSQTK